MKRRTFLVTIAALFGLKISEPKPDPLYVVYADNPPATVIWSSGNPVPDAYFAEVFGNARGGGKTWAKYSWSWR